MKIIRSPKTMQALALRWRREGRSLGFVPTMGALHEGHRSLVRRARRENDRLVASIFVNPAQFGPAEDLSRYPRPLDRDREILAREKTDVLFLPRPVDIYPEGFQTWVTVEELSRPLCGPFRPGHFRGVATVVAKLFLLVQPTRAYFGEKDFQQLRVIQRLVQDLHFPLTVVPCPTVRDRDGLALSSRNAYLKPSERRAAAALPRALQAAAELVKSPPSSAALSRAARVLAKDLRRIPGSRLEYAALVRPSDLAPAKDPRENILAAVALRLGKTRLIDNKLIRHKQ